MAKPSSSTGIAWAKLASGLALLALGMWRLRRPPPRPGRRAGSLVDGLNLPSAFAIGLLIPNPIFAAVVAIKIVEATSSQRPDGSSSSSRSRSRRCSPRSPGMRPHPSPTASRLATWKAWLALHSGQILTALLVGCGALICVHAVFALT